VLWLVQTGSELSDRIEEPENQQFADCLGFNEGIDKAELRDLIVVVAGSPGLAGAVYGASQGPMSS